QGARLEKMVPFAELFGAALETGREVRRDMLRCGDKLYKLAVFTIEPHETVGAVIQDVTHTELKREQIARRAREVIRKNLSTVQEVACRLGEHMADTEILLRSIADDYAEDPTDTPPGDGGAP
ncbi:MAG: [Fe-S]-binding protein, partial [Planctomycetota bacterium]